MNLMKFIDVQPLERDIAVFMCIRYIQKPFKSSLAKVWTDLTSAKSAIAKNAEVWTTFKSGGKKLIASIPGTLG